jgi:hypothetical protein
VRLGEDLRRLERPAEIGRVDGVERERTQLVGEPPGLRARPVSFNGGSAQPCQRPSRFQSVSP